jgi:hypothetical protein
MIASDVLFNVFYFPTNLLRLLETFIEFDKITRTRIDTAVIVLSEITEAFVIASGIWALLITICILLTVKSIHEQHDSSTRSRSTNRYQTSNVPVFEANQTELEQSKRNHKILFFAFAFGLPLAFCIVWIIGDFLFIL